MPKKKLTVLQVIRYCVLLIIVLLIIMISLFPAIVMSFSDHFDSAKTYEMNNLKNLVGIYNSGQAENKPKPQSTGNRFWLALFIGDPDSIEDGVTIDNVYASPSQVSNLLCPDDKVSMSIDQITQEFQEFRNKGIQGWDKLSELDFYYCSYAGPKSADVFKISTTIVGCTGSRDGFGMFAEGFAVVYADQKTEFLEYDDLEDEFPEEWTGDEAEPNWNSTIFKNVINIIPLERSSKVKGGSNE